MEQWVGNSAGMKVCPDCLDVVGPVFARGENVVQGGTCPRHRRPETTWFNWDYPRAVELCRCCGAEALPSGSRYSVWFCRDCRIRVGLLNGHHRRCVLPLGRHSFHWGWRLGVDRYPDGTPRIRRLPGEPGVIRKEHVDDPVAFHDFFERQESIFAVHDVLHDWAREAIRRNLERYAEVMCKGRMPEEVRLWAYENHCGAPREARFGEMLEYLRERAAETSRQAAE